MAPSNPITGLTDELATSLLPKETATSKLKKYKEAFSRKVKTQIFVRTNQFDVSERLERLQEKFQILNNDELADALHARLVKPKQHSDKWIPDVLDLMLRLADDPTRKTKVEWLVPNSHLTAPVPSLTWAAIERDDPINHDDLIWRIAEYSDLSSDDDIDAVTVETPPLDGTDPNVEDYWISSQPIHGRIDHDVELKALEKFRVGQFWRNITDEPFELTELQVIREVLFMLQGLRTALFWKVGDHFEIDKRIRLRNISREIFIDIIADFGKIANRLNLLRNFVGNAQSICFMQTLRCTLEEKIRYFDGHLRSLEQGILAVQSGAATTILQVFENVSKVAKVTEYLAAFVQEIDSEKVGAIDCLEILFDRVCLLQASSDESGFECFSDIFFRCFVTYLKPVQDWMEQGTLLEDRELSFITALQSRQSPMELWQSWYKLADGLASNRCPKFIQLIESQILNVGKTIVFLQHLNAPTEVWKGSMKLKLQQVICVSASSLLPFALVFAQSLQETVESSLHLATSMLRNQLGNNCGLWKTLDALQTIYFGYNGPVTCLVDTWMFGAIDKCDKSWNDRYLLRDLLQTAFEPIESVEVDRLAVKATSHPSQNLFSGRQSVRSLKDLRIEYALPWSIANIITRESLTTYQKVSTFLTQIRRARYMLEHRCLSHVRTSTPDADPQERNLNLLIHQSLLLFVNILHNHLTSFVIDAANIKLRHDLATAIDIDAMIAAHNSYCTSIQDACLISKNLKPIHNEITTVLDLCIRFADLNNPTTRIPTTRRGSSDQDADSYTSATSHQYHRRPCQGTQEDGSSENDYDDDDDGGGGGEGYSTFMVPEESTLLEQLRKEKKVFDRSRLFVVAGLYGIGRAGQQLDGGSWKILARRLDWSPERQIVSW